MNALTRIDCATVLDRAPFFVLGALDAREAAEVREHLAGCGEPHPEFLELGGVAPYLAELVEPVDGGPELRRRVMDAIAADVRAKARDDQAAERLIASFGGLTPAPKPEPAGDPAPGLDGARTDRPAALWVDEPGYGGPVASDTPSAGRSRSRTLVPGWLLSAAAVLVIVVLGAWNVGLQLQAGDVARRADELRQAIAVSTDPGARVAQLTGTAAAPAASGFAAFPSDGSGVLVIRGLPQAPSDRTYQAWYVRGDATQSAGLVRVGSDGLLVATGLEPGNAIDGMAVTLEVAGGVVQSTQDPLVKGTLSA
jgi:hypothetical protein